MQTRRSFQREHPKKTYGRTPAERKVQLERRRKRREYQQRGEAVTGAVKEKWSERELAIVKQGFRESRGAAVLQDRARELEPLLPGRSAHAIVQAVGQIKRKAREEKWTSRACFPHGKKQGLGFTSFLITLE